MKRILRKIRCAIFGHQFRVHQTFSPYSRRVVCDCCDGDLAMHDGVGVMVPWNGEFERMYREHGRTVHPVQRGAA